MVLVIHLVTALSRIRVSLLATSLAHLAVLRSVVSQDLVLRPKGLEWVVKETPMRNEAVSFREFFVWTPLCKHSSGSLYLIENCTQLD